MFKVDLNIQENGASHHTEKYEEMSRRVIPPDLVVRRGQEFLVTLYLSRDYRKDLDGISFVFSIVGKIIQNSLNIMEHFYDILLSTQLFHKCISSK